MTEPISLASALKPLPCGPSDNPLFDEFLLEANGKFNENTKTVIKAIFDCSPFLKELISKDLERLSDLLENPADDSASILLQSIVELNLEEITEADLMAKLRQAKQKAALLYALCDLGGLWSVDEVTHQLSEFADTCLRAALEFALLDEVKRGKLTFGETSNLQEQSGLFALAMGKGGAFELNYSSDIDLIFFYEREKVPLVDPLDFQPVMIRVVQKVAKIMQERNEHGYVFRTDLRLRPDPGSTPVALSTDAALVYYESRGQNWERAAFIKARPVAGDISVGKAFLKELSPFIWRKYMDFAMIHDVHAMKRQTHLHKGHGDIAIRGHNVKLGRGGIREIEFFVQTQQLIAGGRNVELRARGTLEMLSRLAKCGWIAQNTADELSTHYRFLRDIEHRIQMRMDEQTHVLPADETGFEAVSRLMGFKDPVAFENELTACLTAVSNHYSALFEYENPLGVSEGALIFTGDEAHPETIETLEKLGFERGKQVAETIRNWHMGRYRATRNVRAREVLTRIMPKLIVAFSDTSEPDRTLFAFDDFLKSLPAGVQLFSLIDANTHLLSLIAQVMGSAPRLSKTIAKRPHVFDAMLDPTFFGVLPSIEDLATQLNASLSLATDYQDSLDRARIFTQEQQFLIGARVLSGTISVLETQALYSNLADVVIAGMLRVVESEVARTHGRIANGEVTVLAMGKLGGREMTPSSDLDLILIYRIPDVLQNSDGDKPLPASQYYIRLTQRLIAALSAPTGEGVAYEVDLRLRPSGKAGPLATELGAFEAYQNDQAWVWEHMALTRARTIGGSEALRLKVQETVSHVLQSGADATKLRQEALDMNTRLHEAKQANGPFDTKTSLGGLIDIEFLVQYWQLLNAKDHPEILKGHTGYGLLQLEKEGLLLSSELKTLHRSYELYSAVLQIFRLCFEGDVDVMTAPSEMIARLCNFADVPNQNELENKLRDSQLAVRDIFERYLGMPDDLDEVTSANVSGATQPLGKKS